MYRHFSNLCGLSNNYFGGATPIITENRLFRNVYTFLPNYNLEEHFSLSALDRGKIIKTFRCFFLFLFFRMPIIFSKKKQPRKKKTTILLICNFIILEFKVVKKKILRHNFNNIFYDRTSANSVRTNI